MTKTCGWNSLNKLFGESIFELLRLNFYVNRENCRQNYKDPPTAQTKKTKHKSQVLTKGQGDAMTANGEARYSHLTLKNRQIACSSDKTTSGSLSSGCTSYDLSPLLWIFLLKDFVLNFLDKKHLTHLILLITNRIFPHIEMSPRFLTSFWMVSFILILLECGSVHRNPASISRTCEERCFRSASSVWVLRSTIVNVVHIIIKKEIDGKDAVM